MTPYNMVITGSQGLILNQKIQNPKRCQRENVEKLNSFLLHPQYSFTSDSIFSLLKFELEARFWSSHHTEVSLEVLHKIARAIIRNVSKELFSDHVTHLFLCSLCRASRPALHKLATGKEGKPVRGTKGRRNMMTAQVAASHQIAHCSSTGLQSLSLVAGSTRGEVCKSLRFSSASCVR